MFPLMETEASPPRDRRFVRTFASHEEAARAEAEYWLAMTPEERLDAVGECVREYQRLHHEPESGFHRVCRVLERKPR